MNVEWNDLGVIFFGGIVGYLVFRMFKHGGFKGAMFGARIRNTFGEVQGSGQNFGTSLVRVHELEGSGTTRKVGLELVAKSMGGYSMSPIALSAHEARKLAKLINDVAQ